MTYPPAPAAVRAALERARTLGFLGPGAIDAHLANAAGFASAVAEPPARVLDLGSGGGVPGLVLAVWWPECTVVLLDAMQRRTKVLQEAVESCGLSARVEVVQSRAEDAGRDARWRHHFDMVTARSFGPPAVTAECAAPLLRVGGVLLVSEPPSVEAERWPADRLDELGMVDEGLRESADAHIRRLRCASEVPERFPRRSGVPSRRPLW